MESSDSAPASMTSNVKSNGSSSDPAHPPSPSSSHPSTDQSSITDKNAPSPPTSDSKSSDNKPSDEKPSNEKPSDDNTADASSDDKGKDATAEQKPLWGRLVSLSEKHKNVELREDTIVIGRSATQCNVVVDSPAVSGKHCTIIRQRNEYPAKGGAQMKVDYVVLVKDTSTNGTFVNGDPVGKNNTKLMFDGCELSLLPKKSASTDKIAFIFQDCHKEAQEIEQGGPQAAYEMKKELGTGTFASVRLAVHRATGEEVAIKIIDKQKFMQKAKRKDSLMDEVRVLTSVSHPNILQIKGVFETPTTLYLVLELATGGELFDRVAAGAQPEPTANEIFYQILLAIKYLHAQGIAHRDLKPENILLQAPDSNTIKISDFGLSRIIDEGTYMKTVCGTPQYVAPEILTKAEKEGYGKAVDMWSLGVILFVLLGGYAPFEDDPKDKIGAEPLFAKIKKASYSFDDRYWKKVSAEAKDLIRNLLVVDPAKRLTAEQALAHPWMAKYPHHGASSHDASSHDASSHDASDTNPTNNTNSSSAPSSPTPAVEVEETKSTSKKGRKKKETKKAKKGEKVEKEKEEEEEEDGDKKLPTPISARRKRPIASKDTGDDSKTKKRRKEEEEEDEEEEGGEEEEEEEEEAPRAKRTRAAKAKEEAKQVNKKKQPAKKAKASPKKKGKKA